MDELSDFFRKSKKKCKIDQKVERAANGKMSENKPYFTI